MPLDTEDSWTNIAISNNIGGVNQFPEHTCKCSLRSPASNWRMNLAGVQSGARLVIGMYRNEVTLRIYTLGKRLMLFGSLASVALWILMSILRGGGALGELFILIAAPSHVAQPFA